MKREREGVTNYRRPTKEETYMDVVDAWSRRSTCDRGRVAAIFVKEDRVIAQGYAGSIPGFPHCDDEGHEFESRYNTKEMGPFDKPSVHCVRTIHAEVNAILQAALEGKCIRGAELYCTLVPCWPCTKLLLRLELTKVVAKHPYHSMHRSIAAFKEKGVEVKILNEGELYDAGQQTGAEESRTPG